MRSRRLPQRRELSEDAEGWLRNEPAAGKDITSCGAGTDTVYAERVDLIAASRERVSLSNAPWFF